MDLGAGLIAILTALVVKGAVLILGARILFRLYKSVYREHSKKLWLLLPPDDLPEVKVLWWSLILFYISEITCGVEVYVILRSSAVFSGIHGITSGLGMGLFGLGLYGFVDRRFFRYGTTRCLANRICRGCTVEQEEGCKFRLVALLIATFAAMAAVAPFFVPVQRMYADTSRYILPFPSLNAWYDGTVVPWLVAHVPGYTPSGIAYYLPASELFIEYRIEPAIAMACAIAAIVLLRRSRYHAGMSALAFGAGMLCYSYLEMVLYRVTGDVLLGSLGHEVVEFWFLVFTAEFLQRTFGERRAASPQASPPSALPVGDG